MDTLFYFVWKNSFLRSLIRYRVLRDTEINVDNEYLINNHQYMSVLSPQEKYQHNISFQWRISSSKQFTEYLDNAHKHLVDDLDICITNDNADDDDDDQNGRQFTDIDCSAFHDGLHKLSFFIDKYTTGYNKLPDTIVNLNIHASCYTTDRFTSPIVERILGNLPRDLKALCLPLSYTISSLLVLPDNLVEFNYSSAYNDFKQLVVSPNNKDIDGCTLVAQCAQDLEWASEQSWIKSLQIDTPFNLEGKPFPSQIRNLVVNCQIELDIDSFPSTLESLSIFNCDIPSLLPPRLITLSLEDFNERLERGLLPSLLENLSIEMFNVEIEAGALPSSLLKLDLTCFNQPLLAGVLPNGLEDLNFEEYDQPLLAGVLPNSLKYLSSTFFNSVIEPNALPASLTDLGLYSYSGSLDGVGLLKNLKELALLKIDASLLPVITSPSITKLKLSFESIDPSLCLANTFIKYLTLRHNGRMRYKLKANFLPLCLLKLKATKIDIDSSADIIPNGCTSLDLDIDKINLNLNFLPKSVKYINTHEPF
ncbi:hypothetical protein CYY_006153 [Polysphondylium violaceum]|uniref:FNIP repeat-containing protein n=1 Tax=Polysphondylium violaceum TaxID=133409 RepID=A0A8J4Q106_9MYCE|nr:hypothetical protein CYY_006153 [Polysphondylium violaceum]